MDRMDSMDRAREGGQFVGQPCVNASGCLRGCLVIGH